MESSVLFAHSTHGLASSPSLLQSLSHRESDLFASESLAPLGIPKNNGAMLPSIDERGLAQRGLTRQQFARRTSKSDSGSRGDDIARVRGNTKYKALAGDDQITVRKSDNIVLGGSGNDLIDAKKGKGNNTLKGGGGDDELIGGGRDDLLVGGGGADLLVIADGKLNKGISIIKGFKANDAIAIRNVKRADAFEDLTFKKQGKDTLIQVGKRDIALVQNTKPRALRRRADDFVFTDISPIIDPPIVDPPPPNVPVFSIDTVTVTEGDTETVNAIFTATLSQASTTVITVDYNTASGTATPGNDYTAVSGTLTFAPGTTSQIITVPILGDDIEEGNETFTLNVSNASGTTIEAGTVTATILNDDVGPEFRDKRTGKKRERPSAAPDLVFSIFDTLPTGQVITDSDVSENGGLFIGAIENFDFTTDGFFNGIDSILLFSVGDLTTTRFGDFITYQFSSEQVNVDVENPDKSIDKNTTESVATLLLTVDLNSTLIPSDFDAVKAVNNLDYIIVEDVFQYATGATAYGGDSVLDINFSPDICAPGSVCEDLEEEIL